MCWFVFETVQCTIIVQVHAVIFVDVRKHYFAFCSGIGDDADMRCGKVNCSHLHGVEPCWRTPSVRYCTTRQRCACCVEHSCDNKYHVYLPYVLYAKTQFKPSKLCGFLLNVLYHHRHHLLRPHTKIKTWQFKWTSEEHERQGYGTLTAARN